jgi:fermentation-respiration switch protein FrsA (DUF1100 family)
VPSWLIWLLALAGACVLIVLAIFALFQRRFIYYPSRATIEPDFPGVSAVRLSTQDGESLIAWWTPPQAGKPVLLFFDGNALRPHALASRWRRVIDHGAGMLAVFYRGFSGSTGFPTEKGLNADADAGYAWLIAQGFAAQDIVIHGYSLGTGVAVRLASAVPAGALVLEAPYTSIGDAVRRYIRFIPDFIVRDKFDSDELIHRVHAPVLIAQGERDRIVPFAHGARLYELANEPKLFVQVKDAGHADLVRKGLYDRMWEFLDQPENSAMRGTISA